MIEEGKDGWEKMLPTGVAEIIKDKHLFSCQYTDPKEEVAE